MTDQPTLFDVPPATPPAPPAWVPHPGSACCDPAQDLAGWIRAQRVRSERDWRWVTVFHQRGRRLRAIAGRAWTRSDHETGRLYDNAASYCHLRANCIAQEALIRDGDVDRIEQAHQYRLNP